MEIQTAELLKTLSNKTNLEIINLLKNEPSYPRKISEILGMQEAYISRILTQLEKLGILHSQWVYQDRNVKLYFVDTKEINITFEPEGLKIHVTSRGGKDLSVSYDAFTFEIPQITGFVGRERELSMIDRSPIVVIEGIAGIGKTYLTSKYVQKAQKEGKKIFWHTFTEIDSFYYLINKLSVFLNNVGYSNLLEYVKQEGSDPRVLFSLVQKGITEDMVLCFDGFQNVKDEKITSLFQLFKNVRGKVIITSRERPSFLTFSRSDIAEIRLQSLDKGETEAFFHQRGVIVEDGILEKAYLKLGGHPLILDMFCEAVKQQKAEDLLEDLPIEGVGDYLCSEILDKLSDDERELVDCLSLFRVPAPPDILRRIYEPGRFFTVLKRVEKRMLFKRENGNYVLPSIVREFAYRELTRKEALHKKVAQQYLEEGGAEGLLEAMYHFLQAGDQKRAAEIVAHPADTEVIEQGFLSPYLELLTQFSKEQVPPELWCSILEAKGRILVLYGDLKNAAREFEEILKTAEEIHCEKDHAKALRQMGTIYVFRGEWKKAQQCFEESLRMSEFLEDEREMVGIHADIGNLYMKEHRFTEALSHFEAGRAIAEKGLYRTGVSKLLRHIGSIYYYQDQFETALAYYKQSLRIAEESLDVRGIAANYNDLGLIYFYKGDYEEAVACFRKDIEISERISDIKGKISSYGNLGMIYAELMDGRAEEYYRKALSLAEDLEDPYYMAYLKMKIAHLLLEKKDIAKARELCEVCELLFEHLGEGLHYGEFCKVYGMVLDELGEWGRAQEFYMKSAEMLKDSPLDLGKTFLEYSLGLKKRKEGGAQEYYMKALELFEKISKKEMEKAEERWNLIN